jgi:hypothetical protein
MKAVYSLHSTPSASVHLMNHSRRALIAKPQSRWNRILRGCSALLYYSATQLHAAGLTCWDTVGKHTSWGSVADLVQQVCEWNRRSGAEVPEGLSSRMGPPISRLPWCQLAGAGSLPAVEVPIHDARSWVPSGLPLLALDCARRGM